MRVLLHCFAIILASSSGASSDPLRVVTDIAPVHSLVSQVAGDLVDLSVLVTGADDPHHAQLRPSQARAISKADLIIWVGPELTPWLTTSLTRIAPDGAVATLLETPDTTLRKLTGTAVTDPHAWLDPDNAMLWLAAIADRLAGLDPPNAATYLLNAGTAQQKIAAATSEISAVLTPARSANIITTHDALGYFADRFGLNIVATLSDGEAASPGAAHISKLLETVGRGEIACVFGEHGQNSALVDTVVNDTGTATAALDPSGQRLATGPGQYTALISALAQDIAACIKQAG